MLDHAISIKYMLGGYAAFLVLLTSYLVSLIVRWRKVRRDLQSLEDIKKK